MKREMKATDYIAKFLHSKGVRQVFELSGGMITHLLDSLYREKSVRIVSMHHEQAAAFAADAVGRMSGVPGVALATSGPGATNLLTGIGSCYFDSSPAVFITGQVNRNEQKGDRQIRQLGFQETDIVSMARSVTKAAWKLERVCEIPSALEKAFFVATAGRPGPVVIDIPMDVQREFINDAAIELTTPVSRQACPVDFEAIVNAVAAADRPLFLVGGGVRAARVAAEFRALVAATSVPVVHSLMAVDLLPYSDPLRVGLIGTYGNRWANIALTRSDLLIVLGSRLDVRQTGSRTDAFKAGRRIFHVDCEEGELNNRVPGCDAVLADLHEFIPALAAACLRARPVAKDAWLEEIHALRRAWPDTGELAGHKGINPNRFMHELSEASTAALAYVVDVGQHQMWAAQSLEIRPQQRFLTSGGMGSMGFSLPAAIGAATVSGEPVVVIAGDGGFQCNIQELETVSHLKLPIKIVVLNNRCHGMVRQFQESYFESRYQSTYWGYSAPDFAKVSSAYGICGLTIDRGDQIRDALRWLWQGDAAEPRLLQVMVDTFANAYPKVAFGQPISEMEPFSKPLDMEST
jgi:acetolactate synthase-1/2/3 large subunit